MAACGQVPAPCGDGAREEDGNCIADELSDDLGDAYADAGDDTGSRVDVGDFQTVSLQNYTLHPSQALTIDQGNGFRVEFESGSVAASVTVHAGDLGDIDPVPVTHVMDVAGGMYRIGFATNQALLKDVYVQLPFDSQHSPTGIKVCRNTPNPQYPDPLPWDPSDPDYSDAADWIEESVVRPHASGYVKATDTSTLGTFVVCDKL